MQPSSNKEAGCYKRLFTNCFFDNYSESQQGTISFAELHGKRGSRKSGERVVVGITKNSKNIHSDETGSCTVYTQQCYLCKMKLAGG